MREYFTRVEDNSSVFYEINMEAGAFKKGASWLFSVFIKFDAAQESREKYEEFLETKESLIIALEHEGSVKFVGSRMLDGSNELYFYSQDSKELGNMATAILKGSGYVYESNVVRDTKWNLFETQLFPSALEQHNIQSAKIVFLLEDENDDITVSRDVEHYVSFTTPTQKNRFINTLALEGFSFKDDISSEEFEHGVALVKHHAVDLATVNAVVATLFDSIKEEKGFYEGWSTTLLNDKEEDA
jgi:hypothetical protein